MCFEIVDYVSDGNEVVDVVIFNFNTKLVLALHNEVSELDGIDAKIVGQFRRHRDLGGVDLQLFSQKCSECLKHTVNNSFHNIINIISHN